MTDILIYILKVSAAIALVTLPYFLVLRNDASLVVKRIYLVSGLLLSWVFPLLSIKKPAIVNSMDPVFLIDPIAPVQSNANLSMAETGGISAGTVILFMYVMGFLSFLLINIIALIRLSRKMGNATSEKDVRITTSDKVFTIFPKIFFNRFYWVY